MTTADAGSFPLNHEERVEHLLKTLIIQNVNIMGLLATVASLQPGMQQASALLKAMENQKRIAELACAMANIGSQQQGAEMQRQYEETLREEAQRKPVGFER